MFEKTFFKLVTPKNIIFFIGVILFITFIFCVQDVAIMFFASYVIACSMEPLVEKLQRFSPNIARSKACAIVLLGAILSLCLLFIPIVVIGGNEIKTFADSFPQYIESLKHLIYSIPLVNRTSLAQMDLGGVISSASTISSKVLAETINISKNLGSGFVYLLVSILIIYYFMADKDTVKETILKLFPKRIKNRTSEIYDTISQKIGGYVTAQITTMASVGIIVTIGLLLLKIDYALLLGLITAVFDIVPVVGPAVALVVCLIAVYKYGAWIIALTAILFAFAQLCENNFVRPYVFGKLLNIHPLIIYLFLFIAAKYLGIIGVVFAPAIAAVFVVLVEEIYIKALNSKG